MLNLTLEIELIICIKLYLALNNLQMLICYKTKTNKKLYLCFIHRPCIPWTTHFYMLLHPKKKRQRDHEHYFRRWYVNHHIYSPKKQKGGRPIVIIKNSLDLFLNGIVVKGYNKIHATDLILNSILPFLLLPNRL